MRIASIVLIPVAVLLLTSPGSLASDDEPIEPLVRPRIRAVGEPGLMTLLPCLLSCQVSDSPDPFSIADHRSINVDDIATHREQDRRLGVPFPVDMPRAKRIPLMRYHAPRHALAALRWALPVFRP